MPIVIKGVSGEDLLDLLNVSDEDKIWLHQAKPVIHIQATQIVLEMAGVEPVSISAKAENLLALKSGKLPKISKQALQLQFNAAIKKLKIAAASKGLLQELHKTILDVAPSGSPAGMSMVSALEEALDDALAMTIHTSPTTGGTLQKLTSLKKPSPTIEPAYPTWGPPVPFSEIKTAPSVKLIMADKMYQPVSGTSANSRYFAIALSKDLKVAVRYKDNSVAFRVEGQGFTAIIPKLKQVGFTTILDQADTHYASMHLSINDETLALKAVGAVLMGIGPIWETPFPKLKELKNQGV